MTVTNVVWAVAVGSLVVLAELLGRALAWLTAPESNPATPGSGPSDDEVIAVLEEQFMHRVNPQAWEDR